jgi:protein SCO1/2
MKAQTPRLFLILFAFVAGLALCLTTVLIVAKRASVPLPQTAAIGGPFTLTDQNGNAATDQDLKGRPFLVFFGFTNCPDVCPTTLFDISEVFRTLGPDADRAAALFITVDPERDTPKLLSEYLSNFDPHLRGLTGSPEAIVAVEKAYRVYAKKVDTGNGTYTVDHMAIVYLMDKDGRFIAPFNLKRRPEEAAADLRRYF